MAIEQKLIQQTLAGDEQAFSELVEKYQGYVFAIILRWISDQHEAENVAQEVFLQVYRCLPQYRLESFRSWIGKITVRKAIDWQRKKRGKIPEDSLSVLEEKLLDTKLQNKNNPEKLFLANEERIRLEKVCKSLTKIYRRVILKYYLEDKSYQQIACEEGITVKAVESRLYRARHYLREKWEEGGKKDDG